MDIRPFSPEDEDAVVQLWRDCDLTRPWNDPRKDIARKVAEQPELFLVGLVDGQVVGSGMFGYDGHRGTLSYLAVSPKYRRHGLGRQLMDAGEALLMKRGCPKLNLHVRDSNGQVIGFYERIGYKVDAVASMGKRLIED